MGGTGGEHAPERAQTTLDFALGTIVFLLAAGAVLTAVPSLVDPAVGRDPAAAVIADRAADRLTHDVLARPDRPYVLNRSATATFFDGSAATARDRLAVSAGVGLNVTLTNATTQLSVGPAPPERTDSVYPARRIVTVGGEHRQLRVSVW
jgi:hypothetical protein